MAKQYNTNDYLDAILEELQEIAQENKKASKASKPAQSSAQKMPEISQLQKVLKNNNTNDIGSQIGSLGLAITQFSKIKNDDVTKVTKTIETLGKSLKSVKLDKKDLDGFRGMMQAFNSLNQIFGEMSDHFFKNFFRFSPIKGKFLGRRLGKFYKAMFDEFEKAQFGGIMEKLKKGNLGKGGKETMTAFSSFVTSLFAIDWKNLLKIGYALLLFPKKGGEHFAGFLSPIIDLVNTLPPALQKTKVKNTDGVEFEADPRVAQLISLISTLASITVGDVIAISYMAKKLTPEKGKSLNNFIKNLTAFTDKQAENVKLGINIMKSFSLMIGVMTLCLVAIVAMVALTKPAQLAIGIGLFVGLVGFAIFTIRQLSSKKLQESSKDALFTTGAFAILLLSLTACLAITVAIAKNNLADVFYGGLILAALVGSSIGIISLLSRKSIQENGVKSLVTIGSVILLIGGLTTALNLTVKIAKENDLKKDVIPGGLILMAITGLAIGLMYILSRDSLQKNMAKAIFGMAGCALLLVGLVWVTGKFLDVVKKSNGLTQGRIWATFGLMFALIGGVMAVATLLGAIISSGVGAAVIVGALAALGAVELLTFGLIGTLDYFLTVVKKSQDIKEEHIEHAIDVFVGTENSMMTFLLKISAELLKVGVKAGAKMGLISASLKPVFSMLGSFVDVIEKMANMKMVTGYKEDGTPIYSAFDKKIFKDAAEALGEGFSTFLQKINEKIADPKKLKKVLIALKRGNVPKLMAGLKDFVDTIEKTANMRFVTGYDKDGNPTGFTTFDKTIFSEAASTLATAFASFLETLQVKITDSQHLKKVLKAIKKGDVPSLMTSLGSFADTIVKLSGMQFVDGYDEEGNPIYKTVRSEDFGNAATTLANSFSTFLTQIQEKITNASDLEDILEDLKDGDVPALMSSIGQLMTSLVEIGKMDDITKVKASADIVGDSLISIISKMKTVSDTAQEIKMKSVSTVLDAILNEEMIGGVDKLSSSLSKLDKLLIDGDEARVKAMQNMTDKLKGVNEEMAKLNDNIAKAGDLKRNSNFLNVESQNGIITKAVTGAVSIKEKFKEAVSKKEKEEQQNNQQQQQAIQIDATVIAQAVVQGLEAWAAQQRIVNIQFGTSDAKKLVGVLTND